MTASPISKSTEKYSWNDGLVSVIIPVIRNDPHVAECVRHVKESTYKNIEIIVVDEGKERSIQRNIGMDRAKGEYYLILDSDMMVAPRVIEDCVTKIKGHAAVYIPERIVTPGWFGRLRDWERQFYNGTLVDVVRFVRRDCPRFDEALHGVEDSDWERRIAGPKSVCEYPVHHHDKCGLVKFLKKKAYYARCINAYKSRNPDDKLLTFKYRCWTVFTEDGKWKRLVRSPLKTLGVALLLLARGVILIHQTRRYK